MDDDRGWLEKAEENLAAAHSELGSGRYNSCANRAYYACFQAGVYALVEAGVRPRSKRGRWGHDFVQAQFNGRLIGQRHVYPAALRATLNDNYVLRETADYTTIHVSHGRAARALARAAEFVSAIGAGRSATG